MSDFLGICAVYAGAQLRAQRDIERADFGTRMPAYRVAVKGSDQVQIRALFPGLIFTYLSPGYGVLDEIEGVRVLKNCWQPLRISGADEERLNELERDCLLGEFNRVQTRNLAGRFVSTAIAQTKQKKQKKRKCRSLTAKADRRRKRRAKRRELGNHTVMPNHLAA